MAIFVHWLTNCNISQLTDIHSSEISHVGVGRKRQAGAILRIRPGRCPVLTVHVKMSEAFASIGPKFYHTLRS